MTQNLNYQPLLIPVDFLLHLPEDFDLVALAGAVLGVPKKMV